MASYNSVSVDRVHVADGWDNTVEPPTGTRKKVTLTNPHTREDYIFKFPKPRREHQIWSELIASFVAGDLLGWDVQHVSIGTREGQYGNLLRYIYPRSAPGSPEAGGPGNEKFVEGWNYCLEVDRGYDRDRGTRHTLPLILSIYRDKLSSDIVDFPVSVPRREYMDFWARVFAFDTLISNTDRHAEN